MASTLFNHDELQHVKNHIDNMFQRFDVDDQRELHKSVHRPLLHIFAQLRHPVDWLKPITVVAHSDLTSTAILPELLFTAAPYTDFCYVGSSGWPDSFRREIKDNPSRVKRSQFLDWISPHPVTKGSRREKDAYAKTVETRESEIAQLLQREWPVIVLDFTCIYSRTDLAVVDRVMQQIVVWLSRPNNTMRVLMLVSP